MKSNRIVSLLVVTLLAFGCSGSGDGKPGGGAGGGSSDAEGGTDAGTSEAGGGAGGGTSGTGGGGQSDFKRVFVTSGEYSGDLRAAGAGTDGLDGADRICNSVAQGSGLPGSYTAWLSTSTVDAIDRIADVGPWYQVPSSETPIKTFNNKSGLAGTPLIEIQYHENGGRVWGTETTVWTGTATGGRKTASTCRNFTSQDSSEPGLLGRTTSTIGWTSGPGAASCQFSHHLYCFQVK